MSEFYSVSPFDLEGYLLLHSSSETVCWVHILLFWLTKEKNLEEGFQLNYSWIFFWLFSKLVDHQVLQSVLLAQQIPNGLLLVQWVQVSLGSLPVSLILSHCSMAFVIPLPPPLPNIDGSSNGTRHLGKIQISEVQASGNTGLFFFFPFMTLSLGCFWFHVDFLWIPSLACGK